ncbi:hypothetical protein HDV63DRAFT_380751 [Trichoderma sp. SZMC 28014]
MAFLKRTTILTGPGFGFLGLDVHHMGSRLIRPTLVESRWLKLCNWCTWYRCLSSSLSLYTPCRYLHADSNTGLEQDIEAGVDVRKASCVASHKSDKRQVGIYVEAGYNVVNRRSRHTSAWYQICNCTMRETDCQPETRDAMVFLSDVSLYLYLYLFQTNIAGWPRLSCESSPDRQTLL